MNINTTEELFGLLKKHPNIPVDTWSKDPGRGVRSLSMLLIENEYSLLERDGQIILVSRQSNVDIIHEETRGVSFLLIQNCRKEGPGNVVRNPPTKHTITIGIDGNDDPLASISLCLSKIFGVKLNADCIKPDPHSSKHFPGLLVWENYICTIPDHAYSAIGYDVGEGVITNYVWVPQTHPTNFNQAYADQYQALVLRIQTLVGDVP